MTVIDTQNNLVEKKIIETKEGKLPTKFDPANLTNLFFAQFSYGMKFTGNSFPDLMYVLYALCIRITS